MKKNILLALMVILSFLSFAEEDFFAELDLGETVITGERIEEVSSHEIPKNITVVDKEEIKKSGAQNITELLTTVAGVFASNGSINTGRVDIRSMGETASSNVLIMVNGVKINNPDLSNPDINSIPITSIEKIEIINGSGTVLYGDNASGGVINIITSSELNNRYLNIETASYETYKLNGAYSFNINKLSSEIQYTDDNSKGYRDNGGYNKNSIGFNNIFAINESSNLKLNYTYNNSLYELSGYIDKTSKPTSTLTPYDEFKNKENKLNLSYDLRLTEDLLFDLGLNYLNKDSDSKYYYMLKYQGYDGYYFQSGDLEQISLAPKVKYSYKDDSELIFGIDLEKSKLDTETKSYYDYVPYSENSYNQEKNSVGAYVHNKVLYNNLQFNQGLRYETLDYDYYYYNSATDSNEPADDSFEQYAYELGVSYLYSDTGNVYANFSESYRTPNLDELNPSYTSGKLKPQNGYNFEIGIKNYYDNTKINLAVFLLETKDEIYYDPSTWENRNFKDKTQRLGFELNMKTELENLSIINSCSYVNAEIVDGEYKDNQIPWTAKNKYSLTLNYAIDNMNISSTYLFVDDMYSISDWSNTMEKVTSYSLLNLKADYDFNLFSIYAGVNNLFDEKYYNYVTYGSNYYPGNDRNYYLGIRCDF